MEIATHSLEEKKMHKTKRKDRRNENWLQRFNTDCHNQSARTWVNISEDNHNIHNADGVDQTFKHVFNAKGGGGPLVIPTDKSTTTFHRGVPDPIDQRNPVIIFNIHQ